MSDIGDISDALLASHEKSLTQVSVKALGSQVAIMTSISVASILAFSFFRPREKKVYAPKVSTNPSDSPPPPPPSPRRAGMVEGLVGMG